MATKIKLRRGTAEAWTDADPTLAAGEIGVELDTGQFKIGDGDLAWTELPYELTLPQTITVDCPANGTGVIVPELGFDPTVYGSVRADVVVRGSASTFIGVGSVMLFGAGDTIDQSVTTAGGGDVGFGISGAIVDGRVQVTIRVNNSQPTVALLTPYFSALTDVEPTDCPDFDCDTGCGSIAADCAAACEAWYNANCL